MCGINGFNWPDKKLIQEMNIVTRLRGPDDQGTFIDNQVSLGHTRLAIIDLSPSGHQPMPSQNGSLVITYNGEIYNYQEIRKELEAKGRKFVSSSDTEVILQAYQEYGVECLSRFNGMWAFCLYDIPKKQLILSRDRFGVKPLFYYIDKEKLIFSSMIASILKHSIPTKPNDQAIMEFLAYNLLHYGEHTFFENIFSLLPGHNLIYHLAEKKVELQHWYKPQSRPYQNPAQLRDAFISSVQARTISDVPVGSCLSGGVDSSAIVSVLAKTLPEPFSTYSLIVPGNRIDESHYIIEVGKSSGAKQHFVELNAEELLRDLEDFIVCHEEPVSSLSLYAQYLVFKVAHQNGAKVLLDGQGGDELFAGYVYYFGYYFLELFYSLHWVQLLREIVLTLKKKKGKFPISMFLFLLLPHSFRHTLWKKMQTPHINHQYLTKVCPTTHDPRWQKMSVRQSLRLTQQVTSIPHLLRWEDRNSMRWSIESRLPFLDYRLVELSRSIPTNMLMNEGETKVAFKEALGDILPPAIRERKDKIGFEVPEDELLRHPRMIEYLKSIIYSSSFRERPYWNWHEVEKSFLAHASGKKNAGNILWKCINIELWIRAFFENVKQNST